MSVINTNLKALVAQESMRSSNIKLSQAMERLSTGSKINDAKDDAEGFVASEDGKKYYPASSAAGKKIKEEHRVHFKTAEEAEAAGYSA